MSDKSHAHWRLFHRTLGLFIILGVTPILIVVSALALPIQLEIVQFKMLAGLLLVISTVSTLCLAGIVVRLLKHPIKTLMNAQNEIKIGNLHYRIPPDGSLEMQNLFHGFNEMAEGLRLAKEQERLLIEQRSFTKIASQVVHDLRSPLASLKTATQVLSDKKTDHPDLAPINELLSLSVRRFSDICETLLKKHGEAKSVKEVFPIAKVLDDLISEYRQTYSQIQFLKKYDAMDISLQGDRVGLQRALANIMKNGVEAMETKGTMTLQAFCEDHKIVLRIQDTGAGMPPEIIARVLKGGHTEGKKDGYGIGTTVVREVIQTFGGLLNIESKVGVGTTFIITLPIQ